MKVPIIPVLLAVLFLLARTPPASAQVPKDDKDVNFIDFHSALMLRTFFIFGPSKVGRGTMNTGTCFVLGQEVSGSPDKALPVLVTAAHVLDDMAGDEIKIRLRRRMDADGTYTHVDYALRIRAEGRDLFTRHSSADIAAFYIFPPVPKELMRLKLLDSSWVLGDKMFETMDLHTGDEIFVLGYPRAVPSSSSWFSIARGAHISSYPLYPAKSVDRILIDFLVYPGNSGGPVYCNYYSRSSGQNTNAGVVYRGVIGLISAELIAPTGEKLYVSQIVPGEAILETLKILPKLKAKQ